MRKDAQFFRRNAELLREVWLTSGQLKMNRNPRERKPQRSKRTASSAFPKPRSAGKKGAEYFPQKFAEISNLTQKIDISLAA